jgi:hypothetical protein
MFLKFFFFQRLKSFPIREQISEDDGPSNEPLIFTGAIYGIQIDDISEQVNRCFFFYDMFLLFLCFILFGWVVMIFLRHVYHFNLIMKKIQIDDISEQANRCFFCYDVFSFVLWVCYRGRWNFQQ